MHVPPGDRLYEPSERVQPTDALSVCMELDAPAVDVEPGRLQGEHEVRPCKVDLHLAMTVLHRVLAHVGREVVITEDLIDFSLQHAPGHGPVAPHHDDLRQP